MQIKAKSNWRLNVTIFFIFWDNNIYLVLKNKSLNQSIWKVELILLSFNFILNCHIFPFF